jgi:NAD(P)H-flavin reductase
MRYNEGMASFKRAVVVENKPMGGKFRLINFEMKEPEELDFSAGQFVALKIDGQIRDYSIASPPGAGKTFQLIADVDGDGLGRNYLRGLKVGEEIEFMAPLGNFIYKCDDPGKKVLFVATASGIAPLRSMVDWALKEKNESRPMYLYWGLRFRENIFLDEEWDRLAADYGNFKYVICLSKPDEEWPGKTGYVTENIEKDLGDLSEFSAYVCGSPKMVDEVVKQLHELGLPKERCYREGF